MAPEWAWAWPANRRMLYNRASADRTAGRGASARRYLWWDEDRGRWTGHDVRDFEPTKPPYYRPPPGARGPAALSGTDPFIMQADGKGWLFAPGRARGRAAAHPLRAAGLTGRQPAVPPAAQPGTPDHQAPAEPVAPGPHTAVRARRGGLPVRRHHLSAHRALHRRWDEPPHAVPRRAAAGVVLRGFARAGGRAGPGARRLGHDHHRPQRDRGASDGHRADGAAGRRRPRRPPDRSAVPLGTQRRRPWRLGQRADIDRLDPNVQIQETKALTADIRPGRRPRGPARQQLVAEYRDRAGITPTTGTEDRS